MKIAYCQVVNFWYFLANLTRWDFLKWSKTGYFWIHYSVLKHYATNPHKFWFWSDSFPLDNDQPWVKICVGWLPQKYQYFGFAVSVKSPNFLFLGKVNVPSIVTLSKNCIACGVLWLCVKAGPKLGVTRSTPYILQGVIKFGVQWQKLIFYFIWWHYSEQYYTLFTITVLPRKKF